MSTVAMDRWRLVGLSARRAPWSSMLVGRTRQPAQAPPSSPRMVGERGPVALVSGSRRTAARSSAVEYSSGKASIGARVGCVAAAWRRRSVSALLQAQAAVFRVSAVSGGGGSRVPACSPLVVRGSPWARGQEGWAGGPREPPALGGGACPRDSCSGRMNGQCTAVAVGQYSTLTWHISASSPGSW